MENSASCCGKRAAPEGDDGDDAVLREALAFIGDFDFDDDFDAVADNLFVSPRHPLCPAQPAFGAVPSSDSLAVAPAVVPLGSPSRLPCAPAVETEVSPAVDTSAKPAAPSKRASRPHSYSKRRDELQYLREIVQELELRLSNLRKRADEQHEERTQSTNSDVSDDGTDGRASSQVMAAWEQVAARQYEQRHRAEMENIKLKRLLEDQIQVGKSLERVLSRKRPKGLESLNLNAQVTLSSPRVSKTASKSSDRASFEDRDRIFQDLFASIDEQYPETARMFAKAEHTCPTVNHHETRLVHDPDLGLVLQTTECRIFPFKYEETVQTLWESMPDIAVHGPHHIDTTETRQKIQLDVDVSIGATRAAMEVFIAAQRYRERVAFDGSERTVFISAVVVDPTEISDVDMDGIVMRHKGWSTIEALPATSDNSGNMSRHATRMMTYSIAMPETRGLAVADHSRKVGTLTNFVMSSISFDREARQQMVENRLFARSLSRAKQ